MIALAIAGTTTKQGVSYMLLLGGCLGWGVTKPSLDKKCLAQVVFVVVAFIVTDSFRQFHINNQTHGNHNGIPRNGIKGTRTNVAHVLRVILLVKCEMQCKAEEAVMEHIL